MSDLRRRRRGRERRTQRKRVNLLLILGGILAAMLGGVVLVSALAIHSVGESLGPEGLKEIRLGQNTRIYDKDNKLLGIIAGETNRTVVPSSRIPQTLKDATVAIEDKRFYEHDGVDYYRLLGAAAKDIESRSARQGGSTITMQLIKNLYEPKADRTLSKKVEEAYLAFQYEKKYTKDEILTKYLNGVFYGQNAIGVEAASLTYFDKHVSEINLPQAALLAGLPQAPSSYNPFTNPDDARARRNTVLDQMADQGYISRELADKAMKSGISLKRGTAYKRKREEYFFEYVRQALIDKYGEKRVQRGGFKVYTTIDPALQSAARRAIKAQLYYDTDPAAAVVMVDSRKGYIRAMASSQRFSADSQFNLATQALRQPGSTFKTFALTEAVRQGINPYTTLYGSKKLDFVDPQYGPVDVSTYSNTYRGAIPIASALLSSDNSVFQQLTLDVGPDKMIQTAYDMGIPEERALPDVASIGLGSGEVTPLDMATAYSPLSNGGFRVDAPRDLEDRRPRRQGGRLRARAQARVLGRGRLRGVAHPPEQRAGRHRRRGAAERPRRGQDRHHQRLPRRLVRRLHAEVLDRRVGRLPERERDDSPVHDQRARYRRERRILPCEDLARLHAGGRRPRRLLGVVPAAEQPGDLVSVLERLHQGRGRGRILGRVERVDLDGHHHQEDDAQAADDHLPAAAGGAARDDPAHHPPGADPHAAGPDAASADPAPPPPTPAPPPPTPRTPPPPTPDAPPPASSTP